MNQGESQRREAARFRKRGQEQGLENAAAQARSPRQTTSYRDPSNPRQQNSTVPSANKGAAKSASSSGNGESADEGHLPAEARRGARKSQSQAAPEHQAAVIRYTTSELLALRSSRLIHTPTSLSPFTPLRPGSQVKVPDIPQGSSDSKQQARGSGIIGLDAAGKAQKDIVLAPQRPLDQPFRAQSSSQRVFGVPRAAVGGSISAADIPHIDPRTANGHNSKGGPSHLGTGNARMGQGRLGSGYNGQSPARRSSNHESGRLGAASWRSSGPVRGAQYPQRESEPALNDDQSQPEWMDDEITYDESQSVKKMQDMEEWKRRMKEHAGEPNAYLSSPAVSHPPAEADGAASRGSRFLRLFSSNEQAGDNAEHSLAAGIGMFAAVDSNPLALPVKGGSNPQSGDQLSKLFKVLGSKVSVGGHNGWTPHVQADVAAPPSGSEADLFNHAGMAGAVAQVTVPVGDGNSQVASTAPDALAAPTVNSARLNDEKAASTAAGGLAGNLDAAAMPPSSSAQSLSPTAAAALTHQQKPASPAPINEALRGIVPTSVFRKSVQNGGAQGGAKQRPESGSSSRSATPARSLPSWLVELSRGRPSPTSGNSEAQVITNDTLGTNDLVDTLERGFPALSVKSRPFDNQSISSLSVQASVGVPSEINGGSLRRGSIDTLGTEKHTDLGQADDEDTSTTNATQETAESAASPSMRAAASTAAAAPSGASNPEALYSGPHPMSADPQKAGPHAAPEALHAAAGSVASPGPISAPDFSQMQHAMSPHSMMGHGMPPHPHMMMPPPNSNIIPGMIHPSAMQGQMPPMPMMPPPHGFPAGMMYGMVPPPMGMFGGMPPVSVPMAQMNGMPGPINEHQQMMLMKMMMSDMPPAMMYGQMGSAPPPLPPAHLAPHASNPAQAPNQGHAFASGVPYPNVPTGAPLPPGTNGHMPMSQPGEHVPQ
ncbi:hypothetical protein GQ54DRAFT_331746 [Martensiomyces pterosporus]|nr:hypothetical protein GQ54DRAFT_331746 [Martensiomyces pterosporus]